MTEPLLLLDVDGVTSPYRPVPDGVVKKVAGIQQFAYRPTVIATLQAALAGGLHVMWLTTWPTDTLPDLEYALDLPHLPVPDRITGDDRAIPTRWHGWKTSTALATIDWLRPPRWAWIDDDLHPATIRRVRQDHPEGLLLAPDGAIGLTDNQLADVLQWLRPRTEG